MEDRLRVLVAGYQNDIPKAIGGARY